jgi:hypothetical protein
MWAKPEEKVRTCRLLMPAGSEDAFLCDLRVPFAIFAVKGSCFSAQIRKACNRKVRKERPPRHRAIETVPFEAPPTYGANLADTAVVISPAFLLKYSHNSREALVLLRANRNTELHNHGRMAA